MNQNLEKMKSFLKKKTENNVNIINIYLVLLIKKLYQKKNSNDFN